MNALVTVDVGDRDAEIAVGVPSRVEDFAGADMLISAPPHAGDLGTRAGMPLRLHWTGPRGVHELPCLLVRVTHDQVTRWRVRPTGPVCLDQRRHHVRSPFAGSVVVIPTTTGLVGVVTGLLDDLSAGGLRAQLSGVPLEPGSYVEVHVELEMVPLVLAGEVLRSGPVDPDTSSYECVLMFDSGADADRICRAVMHQQMLARRAALT